MDDREKLEHQVALATRATAFIRDESTVNRLQQFARRLRRKLLPSASNRSQITARAYELWQQAGQPPGRDLDFWLEAEREITGRNDRGDQP